MRSVFQFYNIIRIEQTSIPSGPTKNTQKLETERALTEYYITGGICQLENSLNNSLDRQNKFRKSVMETIKSLYLNIKVFETRATAQANHLISLLFEIPRAQSLNEKVQLADEIEELFRSEILEFISENHYRVEIQRGLREYIREIRVEKSLLTNLETQQKRLAALRYTPEEIEQMLKEAASKIKKTPSIKD